MHCQSCAPTDLSRRITDTAPFYFCATPTGFLGDAQHQSPFEKPWCNLCNAGQKGHGPPDLHQPNSSAPLWSVSGRVLKLVIPGGADSRVAAIHCQAVVVVVKRVGSTWT